MSLEGMATRANKLDRSYLLSIPGGVYSARAPRMTRANKFSKGTRDD